jgi:hypothetical protein
MAIGRGERGGGEGERERERERKRYKANVGAWIQALDFLFVFKSSTGFVHLIITSTRKSVACAVLLLLTTSHTSD